MVELNVAIEKLKTKKSCDPDKIHAEFIKNLGQKGIILLPNIFNKVWTGESSTLTSWKKAVIIPI